MTIIDGFERPELSAATRLATYGTLAPGRVNHHKLSCLRGTWRRGTVFGRLVQSGWGGAELGFPALILDSADDPIEVFLFESEDLPSHWARLDDFEGSGYRRVIAPVHSTAGQVEAWIYVTAES